MCYFYFRVLQSTNWQCAAMLQSPDQSPKSAFFTELSTISTPDKRKAMISHRSKISTNPTKIQHNKGLIKANSPFSAAEIKVKSK